MVHGSLDNVIRNCEVRSRVTGSVKLVDFIHEHTTREWMNNIKKLGDNYGGFYPLYLLLDRFREASVYLLEPGDSNIYVESPSRNNLNVSIKYERNLVYVDARIPKKGYTDLLSLFAVQDDLEYYYGIFASSSKELKVLRYLTIVGSYAPRVDREELVDVIRGDDRIGRVDAGVVLIFSSNKRNGSKEVFVVVPKDRVDEECLNEHKQRMYTSEVSNLARELTFRRYFLNDNL